MPELPNVRLNLSNRPENVLLVRQALNGFAQAIGLDGVSLNDLTTAVTEACNNVVLHAYEGEEGPLRVEVRAVTDAVIVTVCDRGAGIHYPLAGTHETASGIGIPIIHTLTRNVEFSDSVDGGTEVRMEFAAPGIPPLEISAEEEAEAPSPEPGEPQTEMWVAIAPPQLARAILPRLLSVLAARAQVPSDRLADAASLAEKLIRDAGPSQVLALRLNDVR
jgi:serine/threonine-protein kinase RsbW